MNPDQPAILEETLCLGALPGVTPSDSRRRRSVVRSRTIASRDKARIADPLTCWAHRHPNGVATTQEIASCRRQSPGPVRSRSIAWEAQANCRSTPRTMRALPSECRHLVTQVMASCHRQSPTRAIPRNCLTPWRRTLPIHARTGDTSKHMASRFDPNDSQMSPPVCRAITRNCFTRGSRIADPHSTGDTCHRNGVTTE